MDPRLTHPAYNKPTKNRKGKGGRRRQPQPDALDINYNPLGVGPATTPTGTVVAAVQHDMPSSEGSGKRPREGHSPSLGMGQDPHPTGLTRCSHSRKIYLVTRWHASILM